LELRGGDEDGSDGGARGLELSAGDETKPVPTTSSRPVEAPKPWLTCALDTVGCGFQMASLAEPLTPGDATLTAVMETGLTLGMVAGGE
jgi:hypothetical protein